MHCKSLWIKASVKCVNVMDKCCVCGKQPWIRSGLQMLPVWKHNESVLLLHIIRNAHRPHTHCRRSIIINILQFLLLCFTEDIDSFRWTSQWTDDDRIFIFVWTLKMLLENVAAPAMFKSSLIWRLTWRLMKIWFCLQILSPLKRIAWCHRLLVWNILAGYYSFHLRLQAVSWDQSQNYKHFSHASISFNLHTVPGNYQLNINVINSKPSDINI